MKAIRVDKPWEIHGPLEAPAGSHILRHRDGTPFFWLGDTQWVLNKLSDEEVAVLLDDRKTRGFTVIQVCAVRWWNKIDWIGDLTWANTDFFEQPPFVQDDVLQFNHSYWQRWRDIIAMAAERGLYVMFMAGSPGRKEGPWQCRDEEQCYQYGKLVGAFFRGAPNLIYSPSMDFEGTMGMGVEGWRAIARGIVDGDGSADRLLTYHPYTSSSKWFHEDSWLKFNGIQGSRNETPDNDILIYQRVYGDYLLADPVKPVVLLEGSYEQERNCFNQLPPTSARNVRMQFFYAFFAGAAGYTYGHYHSWCQHESIGHLDSPAARQMTIGKEFLAVMDWSRLRPDQSMLAEGEGDGEKRKAAVLSQDGSLCLVFFPEAEPAAIRMDNLTGSSLIEVSWFTPVDGSTVSEGFCPASGVQRFLPPAGWEDAVLVLRG